MRLSLMRMVAPYKFLLSIVFGLALSHALTSAQEVDFNRDVRPILSDRCYTCHGPDPETRDSDLRLDLEEGIFADLGGYVAVKAGDPEASELLTRIFSDDSDEVMPPPKSKLLLTDQEKETLKRWVEQGAKWSGHWAFEPIAKPEIPEIPAESEKRIRNDLDRFVLSRLAQEKLSFSPDAAPERWLRRVTLDLIGLPPTPEEVDDFLKDTSQAGREAVVDRLLASEHFGERMALPWLDAARYADTGGYQGDIRKTQWPWRDWVVRAYNRNLPFDQFSIEQLAGDLLPNPTDEQRLATAFNRNHRINDEGGIIPEEFLVEYVADRVETTSTVWMGLTMGCARCHDHKYDPLTQRDFFSMFAFFHNIPEKGKDGDRAPVPKMNVYTGGTKDEHGKLSKKAAELEKKRDGYATQNQAAFQQWLTSEAERLRASVEFVALPEPILHLPLEELVRNRWENIGSWKTTALVRGPARRVQAGQKAKHDLGMKLLQGGYLQLGKPIGGTSSQTPMSWAAWVNPTREVGGAEGPIFASVARNKKGGGYLVSLIEAKDATFHLGFRIRQDKESGKMIEVLSKETIPIGKLSHVAVSWDGSGKAAGASLFLNGQKVGADVKRDSLGEVVSHDEAMLIGAETEYSSEKSVRDELLANTILDDLRVYGKPLTEQQVAAVFRGAPTELMAALPEPNPRQLDFLSKHYFSQHDEAYKKLALETTRAAGALKAFEATKMTEVSVMEEMPEPRDTYLLVRGAYDQPDTSEKLQPSVPGILPDMPDKYPRNRLGFAQWLFSPEHPLTARVAVNRYWQMLFGAGLVRTPEDFGSQGELPTHPDLLDWLASEFRDNGWDTKGFLKQIVLSTTYSQSSALTPELLERDPDNKLLARGSRFRLSGFLLRDQALAVSGRLERKLGGAPVMPYQPVGLWEEVAAKDTKYVVGKDADLYRRSLYTFWRRTVPPPAMMNFDSSSREVCSVSMTRTNTPLQAMNLLNDPQYVEAARLVAERMMQEGGETLEERIEWGHRLILSRSPDDEVLGILTSGYQERLSTYHSDAAAAKELVSIGETKADPALNVMELAALTTVASVLLNLDETVTKE